MFSRWLTWVNAVITGTIALLVLGMGLIWLGRPNEIVCTNPKSRQCGLPKSAFELSAESYQQIGGALLALQSASPTLQIPDLRQQLIYYGKNGRPDAQSDHTLLHFSFSGSKTVISMPPGERVYLVYDRKSLPARYAFSPKN